MNRQPLPDGDFERLLDQHGADSSAWPAAAQQPAAALLASSAAARQALARTRRLDGALDAALRAPPPPLGLKARIIAAATRPAPLFGWLTTSVWRPVGLACMPLLLGFGLGFALGLDGLERATDTEDRVLLALSGADLADYELIGDAP